jgi:hypothetical protein
VNGGVIEDLGTDELVTALRVVAKKGLPVDESTAGEVLPNLKSVYARSVVPADVRSRIAALNELLPRLVATIRDAQWREAVQVLFGLAPGTRKAPLSERQRQIGSLLGDNPDHVRQRVETLLLRDLALIIHQDLLRYRSRVRRSPESLEPTGDTPSLGPEHLNHEEELISRIWQHVYGLRAELIAYLRLSTEEGFEGQAEDHRQAALREETSLHRLIAEYTETYGQALVKQGEAEYRVEALERLAGWHLSETVSVPRWTGIALSNDRPDAVP